MKRHPASCVLTALLSSNLVATRTFATRLRTGRFHVTTTRAFFLERSIPRAQSPPHRPILLANRARRERAGTICLFV